jgi:hypothetical protein
MNTNRRTGLIVRNVALLLGLGVLNAACMAQDPASNPTTGGIPDTLAQPALATYSCGEDGSITVQSLGSAVRVLGTDGVAVDLPAAPPTQTARFGGTSQAIVLEDGEALYMVAGKPTLSCQRS